MQFVHRCFTAGKSPVSTVELLNTIFFLKKVLVLFLEACLSLAIFVHLEKLGCQGPLDQSYDYNINVLVAFNLPGPK